MHALLVTRRHVGVLAVACACATLSACAAPASQPASSSQQAQTMPQATGEAASDSGTVNIDAIFPAAPEREVLLNNCTSCHTFVPIVVLQMNQEAWERNKGIHRSRVPALSDTEFERLYTYLIANFNPNRPVTKLPKALLETWTSY